MSEQEQHLSPELSQHAVDIYLAHEIGQGILDGVAGLRMGDSMYGVATALACLIGGAYALHEEKPDEALETANEIFEYIRKHITDHYGRIEVIDDAAARQKDETP